MPSTRIPLSTCRRLYARKSRPCLPERPRSSTTSQISTCCISNHISLNTWRATYSSFCAPSCHFTGSSMTSSAEALRRTSGLRGLSLRSGFESGSEVRRISDGRDKDGQPSLGSTKRHTLTNPAESLTGPRAFRRRTNGMTSIPHARCRSASTSYASPPKRPRNAASTSASSTTTPPGPTAYPSTATTSVSSAKTRPSPPSPSARGETFCSSISRHHLRTAGRRAREPAPAPSRSSSRWRAVT